MPSSEDVRVYEIAVMTQPDLHGGAESTLLKEVDAIFAEANAKLLFKDPWTKRGLAYPIGGFTEAKFVIYYFEIDPAKIREIDGALRLQKGVLRHLIIMPPKGYEAVSYEERYQTWLTHRETAADVRTREKEEKLRKSVEAKAKRETKRLAEKEPAKPKAPMKTKEIHDELDKLISDEDLKF